MQISTKLIDSNREKDTSRLSYLRGRDLVAWDWGVWGHFHHTSCTTSNILLAFDVTIISSRIGKWLQHRDLLRTQCF